jgi:hypothetical protein
LIIYFSNSLMFMTQAYNYLQCVYVCICTAVIVLLLMIDRCEFLLSCSFCSRRALGYGERCKYVLNACQSAVWLCGCVAVWLCVVISGFFAYSGFMMCSNACPSRGYICGCKSGLCLTLHLCCYAEDAAVWCAEFCLVAYNGV